VNPNRFGPSCQVRPDRGIAPHAALAIGDIRGSPLFFVFSQIGDLRGTRRK
jgi:hypothetical protein